MTKKEEDIKKRVIDHLYWDNRVDASKIKVDVKESEITLKGSVENYNAREAAVLDAWQTRGVTKVNNEISVKYPPAYTIPSDKEIKSSVENLIAWNPNIDSTDIDIKIKNGFVDLEGTVDAYWKKTRVEQIASGVSGVLEITNKLAVVPTEDIVDKVVAEDIASSIDRKFSVDIEDVNIKVKDGKATLSGTVPNWSAYRAAIESAENTAGVTEIVDNIIIT
ncbi:MAG: BON domain-containing protein [Candidatus Heimdallarchaeota archaeon]|nr:BON domain-containing protein [Candidatus Heimdallarchaeota archaeon]